MCCQCWWGRWDVMKVRFLFLKFSISISLSLCFSPYIPLSGPRAAVHGLRFQLCGSNLKPNTGTRSHLPHGSNAHHHLCAPQSQDWGGTGGHTHTHTQPPHHPCGACITLELVGGRWMGDHLKAYDQSTPCLHVWSVLGLTVRWDLLWPSINLHDLPQAVCSVSHSHSEDSVSAQPCFRFLLSTQGQTGEAVGFRKGMDAVTKWLSKSERAEVKRCK